LTKLFAILPSWVWALALAGALAAYGVTGNQLRIERGAHLHTKLTHAEQVASAQAARANEEARRRQTEQELNDATEIHAKEVATLSLAVAAADTRARAAAAGLRSATQAAASRARSICADSATSELRAPADDPIGMLAYVLGRIDERATDLARIADDRGLAGRACEREFDAAREKLKEH
jgi:hypothetical protein